MLLYPMGLAIDKFHNLNVSDTGNNRVQVFTLDEKFVSTSRQPSFSPSYVAVSRKGNIVFSDLQHTCVCVFHCSYFYKKQSMLTVKDTIVSAMVLTTIVAVILAKFTF